MLVDAQGEVVFFEVKVHTQLPIELRIEQSNGVDVRVIESPALQGIEFSTYSHNDRLLALDVVGLHDDTFDTKEQEPQRLPGVTLICMYDLLLADLDLSDVFV